MDWFGDRLKVWRESQNWTQPDVASKSGVSKSTYQKYELNLSAPGAEAILGFVGCGLNANWLLTGQGPMLLADLVQPAGSLDQVRLRLAVEAAEEGLQAAKRVMAPDKKAELILAIYDLLEEPAVTKERVLKLVKFAA